MINELLKKIPKVDKLLSADDLAIYIGKYRPEICVMIIREVLDDLRQNILSSKIKSIDETEVIRLVRQAFTELAADFIKPVVNGTGVVLNTGLGRAPLSEKAIEKAVSVMRGFSSLEYDIPSGKRGRREDKISRLVSILTGAEAATVVNNNAAAVLICLNTLAEKKEVIISRSEQVEIGGAFRMPDIIKKAGGKMIEVGTTNKTYASDYSNAITSKTGLLIKVHTSNYKVVGFVEETSVKDLAEVKKEFKIPFYYDLGGGIIKNLADFGLPYEPLVQDAIRDGADLISFSGDKVLGGPQCGIIAGKKELVDKIKKNPLMRVLRTDKVRLALLEETLKLFLEQDLLAVHQTMNLLSATEIELKTRAEEFKNYLTTDNHSRAVITVCQVSDQAGSGTLPTEKLPGYALKINIPGFSAQKLSRHFRISGEKPVIGYIQDDEFYLSVRTISAGDFAAVKERLNAL